ELLPCFGSMPSCREHFFTAEDDLYGPVEHLAGDGGQGLVWPDESFAAESATYKARNNSYVFWRYADAFRNDVARANNPLRCVVERERIVFPVRERRVHLHWIVMFNRRAVFGLHLGMRGGETLFEIATLLLQLFSKEGIRCVLHTRGQAVIGGDQRLLFFI